MKKFAKMSLVAAVAVAGMTSASAADLAEAIKGVDVSGQFRLRYEDNNTNTDGSSADTNFNDHDMELEVTAKIPVNDMVTAVIKVDNGSDDSRTTAKSDVTIEDFYFQYVNGATTVNLGQQNIPGRITDGAQGDGLVALQNLGDFTVGAAAFITNDIVGVTGQDVYSVIGMGSVGPVSVLAQYADVVDTAETINIKADATVGPVTAGVEYSTTEFDAETADNNDHETFKAYVSGSIDALSLKVTYASTGKDGSGSLEGAADDANYGNGAETPAEFLLWQLGSATKNDFSVVAIDASYALTDKVSLRAAYADGDQRTANSGGGDKNDVTEILGQVSYKMSSNLNTYFRISQLDTDVAGTADTEQVRGRVEVQYTF